jgi:hypothetical protein
MFSPALDYPAPAQRWHHRNYFFSYHPNAAGALIAPASDDQNFVRLCELPLSQP